MKMTKKALSLLLCLILSLSAFPVLSPGTRISAEEIAEGEILSAEADPGPIVTPGTSYEAVLSRLPATARVTLASGGAPAAETFHTAAFTPGAWTLFDGEAISFSGGALTVEKESTKVKALTGEEYGDFVLEATLRGTSAAINNNFGVMLRASDVTAAGADSYRGYYVGIGRYGSSSALTVGYADGAWHLIKAVPTDYRTGQDYALKVLLCGETLAVWLDGKLLYRDELSLFSRGRVGLRTYKQLFSCSSFAVRTPSPAELDEAGARPSRETEAAVDGWSCPDYRADVPGTYCFTGRIRGTDYPVETTVSVAAPYRIAEAVSSLPYGAVRITGGFFREYIRETVCVIVPTAIANVEKTTGGIPNIRNAAKKNRGEASAPFSGAFYVDSDVHKVLESMCYALAVDAAGDAAIRTAQESIRKKLEEWIPYYLGAQEPSGYFDTYYTLNAGEEKFSDTDKHELYCMGHFIEAAVAHHECTNGGDSRLFDMAIRCADYLAATFGEGAGRRKQIAGHQEIELALLRLARRCVALGGDYAAKASVYAGLAAFFLDVRGDYDGRTVMGDKSQYRQDHLPVDRQLSAVGHAVRAQYMYAAMAELASLDQTYAKKYDKALNALWRDVSETKQYVTGGVGQTAANEGFAASYFLPDKSSYCETCAGIANMMWNRAMGKLYGSSAYADRVETDLYNTVLGCVGFDGDSFFYQNRLASMDGFVRNRWFGTACCPPNLTRTLLSLGGYLYRYTEDAVLIDQYVTSEAAVPLAAGEVSLTVESELPWQGRGSVTIAPGSAGTFSLSLRLPSWTERALIRVNGREETVSPDADGYLTLRRAWRDGDRVDFEFPMPVLFSETPAQVKENVGRVSLRRGPIVYCAEGKDNDFNVFFAYIDRTAEPVLEWTDSLDGKEDPYGVRDMMKIKLPGKTDGLGPVRESVWTFIPFYARANRGSSPMTVYVQTGEKERALHQYAVPSASYTYNGDSVYNLNDGTDSKSNRWTSWNAKEVKKDPWVRYDFDEPVELSGCRIWWYQDSSGVKLPKGLGILYRDEATGAFRPVTGEGPYSASHADGFITYRFETVRTTAIRVAITNGEKAVGIVEWELIGKMPDRTPDETAETLPPESDTAAAGEPTAAAEETAAGVTAQAREGEEPSQGASSPLPALLGGAAVLAAAVAAAVLLVKKRRKGKGA